jgi:mannosyltransferase OCH1-like enzyme
MIPKNIITIWLSEEPMPELVQKCVATHKIPGYNHIMVTLDNCYNDTPYIQHCLKNKYWVKAADYLRLRYLHEYGGIYLDADIEVTGLPEEWLFTEAKMIVFPEESGYIWNGCIFSEPRHNALEFMIRTIENGFNPEGETFRLGMQFFTDTLRLLKLEGSDVPSVEERLMEYFQSWAKHHELKSWVKK